jgi:hypothetical protein
MLPEVWPVVKVVQFNRVLEADIGIWLADPDFVNRGVDCVIVLIALRIDWLVDFSPATAGVGTGEMLNGVATKEETEEAVGQATSPAP